MPMTEPITEWFFTAPLDDVLTRRGDPLGMRATAEDMAEELAPGLSNGTIDGRWISILCWSLQQSQAAWRAIGSGREDGAEATPAGARELYTWLRPLELLWVARTAFLTVDSGRGRQLRGIRPIRRWIEDDRAARFGFAEDSYRRYRFTGMYSAYRVALRSLPGLTMNRNGWHPGAAGCELADIVGAEASCSSPRWRRAGRQPAPERHWQDAFDWKRETKFLPTMLGKPGRLPRPERDIIRQALFSIDNQDGARRLDVVEAAAGSSAQTMHGLFDDIALKMGGGKGRFGPLAALSAFCELADAGVDTMNACWAEVANGNGTGLASLAEVLESCDVKDAIDALTRAARRWTREESAAGGHSIPVAGELAAAIVKSSGRTETLISLERHHKKYGGGLKWLAIEGDRIKPLALLRGGATSRYQFRIAALARLAVQTGVIDEMPHALRDSLATTGEDEV